MHTLSKLLTISSILVMSMLTVTACAQSSLGQDLVVTLDNPGKPGTLKLDLMQGSIRVVTHNGKEVIITPQESTIENEHCDCDDDDAWHEHNSEHHHEGHEHDTDELEGMTRINTGQNINITVNQDDNIVQVRNESWNRPIDFEIKVPRNFNLTLKTVNHGEIKVDGVTGKHEISNVNGSIALTNMGGSVITSTVNGDIEADFVSIDEDAPMAFNTLNGDIKLLLPPSASFGVKLQSQRGEVYTDFPFEAVASQPRVEQSGNGRTTQIKIEDWTYGNINGGGPEYIFKSFHGDIIIKKRG